jgi:heme A synthase
MHRSFAVFLTFLVIYLNYIFFKESNSIKDNFLFLIFNITFIVQILLGVLMTFQNIPWHLALAHQGNAIILFLIAISMWMFSKKSLQNNLL